MAVALSQLGGRTLLIDADLRSPRQHEIFKVNNHSGLSSILSGRSEGNVLRQVEEFPSLFVMPVGVVPPNPLELLQRPAFGLRIIARPGLNKQLKVRLMVVPSKTNKKRPG